MSLDLVHLSKLVRLMGLPMNRQTSELRNDITTGIRRELGSDPGGPDYFGAFWFDAREHMLNRRDLHIATADRIAANDRRKRLYPLLRDGFLLWWNERRRWTNAPFEEIMRPRGQLRVHDGCTVKIQNLIAVRDALDYPHYVYPYFSEFAVLSEPAARECLWAIGRSFPQLPHGAFTVLDVLRGTPFSIERTPLVGDEEARFGGKVDQLLGRWDELRSEYI